MPERFPPPWTVRDSGEAFYLEDAEGHRFGFVYYRDRPLVGTDRGVRLERDSARRLAVNFAKLPELLGKARP